jgi:hypothetical protein
LTAVAWRRLAAQRLVGEPFGSALEAVSWLGAVQSQDYGAAKWAVGQRVRGATDAALDRLYDSGELLRTHVMRPTWHLVLPADVRWLLELTAPRVRALLAHYDRRLELDPAELGRARAVLETALRDGRHRTRAELATELERAGIAARGQRLGHILMHAELYAVVVSCARRGRSHTYALLEERAPGARRLGREAALGELTLRYFTGHGPARATDFAWWSGLSMADVRLGLDLVRPALTRETLGGRLFWSASSAGPVAASSPVACLLSNYDEYMVGFRDRTDALDPDRPVDPSGLGVSGMLDSVVILDGRVWGGWRRRHTGRQVTVELGPLHPLDAPAEAAVRRAAGELGRFLDAPVTLTGIG